MFTINPLSPTEAFSIRAHLLLELVANHYSGIDLVATRAELDRRLAARAAAAKQRYPVAEGAQTLEQYTTQMQTNEKTMRQARRDVAAKIIAATE